MIWIWSTLPPLLTPSQVQSPIVASDIVPPLPKIGSHQSQPYFDKSWYGYLHAAIKDVVTKTLIMIRFKQISFNQTKHNNFDTLSIEQPVFSIPWTIFRQQLVKLQQNRTTSQYFHHFPMAERHISPQQHYCIFGECFNIKISLKTAWYGIIRNYRPSEAASTIPQRGIWHSMVPTSHLLSNNSILYIEQNIPWKRTFNERQPLLKDELWSKMTFNVSFFRFFDQKSLVSGF